MSQLLLNISNSELVQNDLTQEKAVLGTKKIRYACRDQIEFCVRSLDSLIPEDHRARDIWEYVSKLDVSVFKNEIQVLEGCRGAPTIDPKILIALWLYAILEGVFSARHIARLSEEHNAYIWICGGVSVSYHTLSDFHSKGGDKLLTLLQESIALIWKAEIFHPETVAQDGTKVKANAGYEHYKREATLTECLEKAKEHIENLKKEQAENPSASTLREKAARERAGRERLERIENAITELDKYKEARILAAKEKRKQVAQIDKDNMRASMTDPEARKMKMGDGGFRIAYNVQFATETEKKVILGVSAVNTMDPGTLVPMMNQVKVNLSKIGCPMPTKWLADSAYANKKDAEKVENEFPNITLFAPPTSSQEDVDPLTPRKNDNKAMINLRNRMKEDTSKEIYKKRCETAEFVNAVAKNCGMDEFLVRGIQKVTNMALLYAVAHNMSVYLRYS